MGDHLVEAFRKLREAKEAGVKKPFLVPNRNYQQNLRKAENRRERQKVRKLIKAENARELVDEFPACEGSILHAVVGGNFIIGDILPSLVAARGTPRSIAIATLSLSVKNIEDLAGILRDAPRMQMDLLISHYFQNTSGEIFQSIEKLLVAPFGERFRVKIARSHAKLILFDYESAPLVIETSGNLRSSNNIEQLTVSCDRGLLDFHRKWISEVM